jgi:hypothetical protein
MSNVIQINDRSPISNLDIVWRHASQNQEIVAMQAIEESIRKTQSDFTWGHYFSQKKSKGSAGRDSGLTVHFKQTIDPQDVCQKIQAGLAESSLGSVFHSSYELEEDEFWLGMRMSTSPQGLLFFDYTCGAGSPIN